MVKCCVGSAAIVEWVSTGGYEWILVMLVVLVVLLGDEYCNMNGVELVQRSN